MNLFYIINDFFTTSWLLTLINMQGMPFLKMIVFLNNLCRREADPTVFFTLRELNI